VGLSPASRRSLATEDVRSMLFTQFPLCDPPNYILSASREGPLMRPYNQSQAGPADFPINLDMEGLMKGLPVGPQ
ncbi:hypothetical protein ACC760_37970, partial [Rhizobium ruizarguesonis]